MNIIQLSIWSRLTSSVSLNKLKVVVGNELDRVGDERGGLENKVVNDQIDI